MVYVVDAKINASDKDLPVTRGRLALTNNLICVNLCLPLFNAQFLFCFDQFCSAASCFS